MKRLGARKGRELGKGESWKKREREGARTGREQVRKDGACRLL